MEKREKLRLIFTVTTLILAITAITVSALSVSLIAVPGLLAFLMAAAAISLCLMFYFGNSDGKKAYIIVYAACIIYALYKIITGIMQIVMK